VQELDHLAHTPTRMLRAGSAVAGTHPPDLFSPASAAVKQQGCKHRGRAFDAVSYLLESYSALQMTGTTEVGMGPQGKIDVRLQSECIWVTLPQVTSGVSGSLLLL